MKQIKMGCCSTFIAKAEMAEVFTSFQEEYLEIFGDEDVYEALKNKLEEEIFIETEDEKCPHTRFFDEDGLRLCLSCGCVIHNLNFEPEWRYYGASDTRSTRDPSRCHRSRDAARSRISKVFEDVKMPLAQSIIARCEQKYQKMVGDETVRGKGYKARVAACWMYVSREDGIIYSAEETRQLFNLKREDMSEGITAYLAAFPADRVAHIKPADLTRRIMKKAGIDMKHYTNIFKIARLIEGADLTLNHSTPQAVASAVAYFYLCLHPELKEELQLTKTRFASKVELSDITVNKLSRKISEVLACPITI